MTVFKSWQVQSANPVPWLARVYILAIRISHLPELIDLSLSHPNLTNLSAENLAELKPLKRLSLAGSGLTNAGIKHLANLTNLESIDLRRTKATAAAIDELKAALPKCKIQWDVMQDK